MPLLQILRPTLPILIGASLMLTLSMGLRQSLGIFLQPLTHDIHISVSDFTLALAVQNLAWGFLQPLAGAMTVRYGFRPIMMVGSVFYIVGLALMASAQGLVSVMIGGGAPASHNSFGVFLLRLGLHRAACFQLGPIKPFHPGAGQSFNSSNVQCRFSQAVTRMKRFGVKTARLEHRAKAFHGFRMNRFRSIECNLPAAQIQPRALLIQLCRWMSRRFGAPRKLESPPRVKSSTGWICPIWSPSFPTNTGR